jgi:O-antigen/teichoic acid export membrane protein
LAGVNAIGGSITYLLYFYMLTRNNHMGVKVQLSKFEIDKLYELLHFGFKSLIQGISSRVENATDSLVIGFFLGPASVPFYMIPANLVQYIRTFGALLTHVFMPIFSGMAALSKDEEIRKTYLIGSKYCIAIVAIASVGAISFGASFISMWIGSDYGTEAANIIFLLVIFTVLPLLNPFGSRYLTAIGRHGIFAKWGIVSAIINLLASCLLVNYMGIVGVAVGSLIPGIIFVPIYLKEVCRHIGFTWQTYVFSSVLPSFLPTVVMFGVCSFFSREQINSYPQLFGSALVATLSFIFSFYLLSITKEEKLYVFSKLKPNT